MRILAALILAFASDEDLSGVPTSPILRLLLDRMTPWLLLAAAWVALIAIDLHEGWPQMKETGSAFSALLRAALGLAALAVMPLAILAVHSLWVEPPASWWVIAVVATTICMVSTSMYLRPPIFLHGTKAKLPRVLDPRLLNQVSELAGRMQVPVPLVRLWPSTGSTQSALAFAGTIHAPQLVVTDGIVQRLEPAECDAIIAHEVAHFANGSLWWLCATQPVACAVTVGVLPLLPPFAAVAFGFAFQVGLTRLVSRPIELDCDRRAAKAIGFRATIDALAKIHAIHPIGNSGWLPMLWYSTCTHPSRDVRLAALYDAAPPEDRPSTTPDRTWIVRHQMTSIAALVIWVAALAGTLIAAALGDHGLWQSVVLWMMAFAPTMLGWSINWNEFGLWQRRTGQWHWLLKPALIAGAILLLYFYVRSEAAKRLIYSPEVPFAAYVLLAAIPLALGGLALWTILTKRRKMLLADVLNAFQVHDFRGALELCLDSPKVVRGSSLLRYNQALAQAACGDVREAIETLESLWVDRPKYLVTGFMLCALFLKMDQPERVIELARDLAGRLPRDPQPPYYLALASRRLNRLEEAEAACRETLKFKPESGPAHALLAALALDRNDIDRAAELFDKAWELAPGDDYLRIVEAEIALCRDPVDVAREAVTRAVEANKASWLCVMDFELRRLEERLTDGVSPVATEDIFLE